MVDWLKQHMLKMIAVLVCLVLVQVSSTPVHRVYIYILYAYKCTLYVHKHIQHIHGCAQHVYLRTQ